MQMKIGVINTLFHIAFEDMQAEERRKEEEENKAKKKKEHEMQEEKMMMALRNKGLRLPAKVLQAQANREKERKRQEKRESESLDGFMPSAMDFEDLIDEFE